MTIIVGIAYALVTLALATAGPVDEKKARSISLFSIVQFNNDECQAASSTTTQGICYSSTDCTSRGGTKDGNCAAGFGQCCTFIVSSTSGGTIAQNCSYLQNNGYPSTITSATSAVTYTINPVITDICQLRFDVVNLKLDQTATTGVCTDTLAFTSPSGISPPTLCGTSSGDHVYSEVGKSSTGTKVVVTIASASTTTRSWKIKVTQIECYNPNKPPTDCTQWYTATQGTFQTLGFSGGLMPTNLNYGICFKGNLGFCGIEYSTDVGTTTPDPFGFYDASVGTATVSPVVSRSGSCDTNWIGIPRTKVNNALAANTYCGNVFNAWGQSAVHSPAVAAGEGVVVAEGPPFRVNIVSHVTSVVSSPGGKIVYAMSGC